MQRQKLLLAFLVGALVTLSTAHAAATGVLQSATHVGQLADGSSLFWDGGYVSEGRAQLHNIAYFAARTSDPASPAPDPCAASSSITSCFLYAFDVASPGELRVAIDSSNRGDCFGFELSDPAGRSRVFPSNCPVLGGSSEDDALGGPPAWHAYTIETSLEVAGSDRGTWQMRVVAGDVSDWAFRVRAALGTVTPPEPELLEPNLRPWLPWEFGLAAPANPKPGSAMDHENPAGPGLASCTASELEQASHCLRFSSGVMNVGRGPLFVGFDDVADLSGTQYIFRSDATPGVYTDNLEAGAYESHEAGTSEWHDEHGHRHFSNMVLYELFSVGDAKNPHSMDPQGRRLEQVTTGHKEGYCTADHGFGDWSDFHQDGQFSAHSQLGRNCGAALAASTGWGDVYRWQRQGQYVPFDPVAEEDGSMRPGFYLVRVTIDPDDRIRESSENDNTGYALIRVADTSAGDEITICERGLGDNPWHPHREVIEEPFWWSILRASQAPEAGECDS